MPADPDPMQVVNGLVGAVRSLTSDANYKLVADVFSEVLSLKEQNDRLSMSHRETLEEYRKFRNELEANEREILAAKAALESAVQEKEQALTELNEAKDKLESTVQEKEKDASELSEMNTKLDEELAGSKIALQELDDAKTKLEDDLATSKISLSELQEAKAKLEVDLTNIQTAMKVLEDAKGKIDDDLKETNAKLKDAQALKDKLDGDLAQANGKLEEQRKRADDVVQELSTLHGTLADRDAEILKLKDDIKAAEERVLQAVSSVEELQKTLGGVQRDLQVKSARLSELESFSVPLRSDPEDVYVAILDTIWTSIFELVASHFRQDLDEKVLADSSCWSNLRNSEYLKRPTQIPLPQSNSPVAKAMRIAAVLAILSRAVHKHIFQPVYLIDGHDGHDTHLTQLLREAESDNPEKEMHIRASMLALLPERQHASAEKRVRSIVRDVSWVVQHLLGALQFDTFCTGLGHACALACGQWRKIQEARTKIEPYFGPPYDEFDWQMLPLAEFEQVVGDGLDGHDVRGQLQSGNGQATNGASTPGSEAAVEDHQEERGTRGENEPDDEESGPGEDTDSSGESELEPDDILLVVWPSMCAVEGGELSSITQGLAISKTQARGAFQEVKMRQGPRPSTKRARSMSIPGHSINGSPVPGKAFLWAADGDVSGGG